MNLSKHQFLTSVAMMLISCIASSQVADAKMVATTRVSLNEVLADFKKTEASGKLTEEETNTLNLVKVCQSVGVTSFTVPRSERTRISNWNINNAILAQILKNPKWDTNLTSAEVASISPHRKSIEKAVGGKTYAWAWFLYQFGEKADAKKVLTDVFDGHFQIVMKSEVATYGLGEGPLGQTEYVLQALEPMSSSEEKSKFQAQMQKMKIHISNLPQSHVVT